MTAQRAAAWSHQTLLWAGCGGLVILGLLDLAGVPVVTTLPLPSLLLATGVLLWGSWLLTNTFSRQSPLDLKLLDTGLLALAAMATLGLLLGTLGVLRFSTLMLGAGVVAGGGVLLATRWLAGETLDDGPPAEDKHQTDTAGLLNRLPHWTTLLLAGLTAFAFVQAIVGRRFRPPIGDPLAYHLPFAVEWLQHGDLRMPVPAAGDPSTPFYPLNSSLWMFWTLAPFDGEILTRYVQVPFLILLGLAVYRLTREIGARTNTALAATALSVTLPDISRSASLPENDLILAALLIAATAGLARLWHEPSRWRVAMTALPLGLAAGTKVTALPYVGLLALALAGVVFWRWKSQGLVKPVGIVLAAAGLVTLLGGYSYLRNAVVMDNPLYPSGYVLFGREIVSGIYVMTSEWRRSHIFYPFDWSGFFFGSRRTFGYTVTFWILPGLLAAGVALVATLRSTTGRLAARDSVLGATSPAQTGARDTVISAGTAARQFNAGPALVLCLWSGLSLGVFWFIIPYHFSRFLYPTVVWGIVAAAWGFGALLERVQGGRYRTLVPVLALPFVVLNVVNIPLNLAIRGTVLYWVEAVVVIAGAALAIAVGRALPAAVLRRALLGGSIAIVAVASLVWPFYESSYEDRRFNEWRLQIQGISTITDGWEWLHQVTEDERATIAVAGTNDIYPLYGEGLNNRIVTIRPSGVIAGYDWGRRFQLFGAPDQAAWLAALDRASVDYIYMTEDVSLGGWPPQRAWVDAAPDRFALVFQNDAVSVWSVASE